MSDPKPRQAAPKSAPPARWAPTNRRSRWSAPDGVLLLLAALALLGGAVWLIYGRAIDSPFVFDDKEGVLENASIVRLWPLVGTSQLPGPLNPPKDQPISGRPLVNFTLALNYHFGQYDPVGYHVFNLIVHLLSALLLMAIVRRTLCLDYFEGKFESISGPLALAAALLWAVHPLQTETVIYVTQRTELLVGFFYLATIYGSLRYWSVDSSVGRTSWLVLTVVSCLAGMACKEVMVTAPVMVLLFERTFIAGSFRQTLRQSWPLYVGLVLSWMLLLGLNYDAPRAESAGFHLGVSATEWWLTQTKILWLYLKLAFWPWPLSVHYGMPYLTTVDAALPWLLLTILLSIATLVLFWRRSPIGFVSAWVLVILSPTLVVPVITEVAAERRMYLPLAALITLVVVGGYALTQRVRRSLVKSNPRKSSNRLLAALTATIALLLAVALSLISVQRLAVYHDSLTLWQDVLASQPDDYLAHNNLGNALQEAGRTQDAMAEFQKALRLKPTFAQAHYNLANAFYHLGQTQTAIDEYHLALRLKPDDAAAHDNLGSAFVRMGRLQEALQQYEESLRLKPSAAITHTNLGNVLCDMGRTPEAIEHYQEALRLKPDYAEAYNNLGVALADANQPQQAIENYRQALKFKPDYADAHNNLGSSLLEQQKYPEAIEQYRQAVRLKSDYPEAYANLATAYTKIDRFTDAIAAAQKAIDLAQSQGRPELAQQIQTALSSYRAAQAKLANPVAPTNSGPAAP